MKVVAIHQPNYLPWLGYFDKIRRADVFVLLDTVQYAKESWINRVKIRAGDAESWLTVPVLTRGRVGQAIRDTEIDGTSGWARKHLQALRTWYGRAPGFRRVFPVLEELLARPWTRIAELNEALLRTLCALQGLATPLVRASGLAAGGAAGAGTDLLIALVRAAGGDTYLCGGGAGGYQEDAKFAAAGIALVYQDFKPDPYPQTGAGFLPGLSAVDWLMNR